jgi:hypothetical protein
MTMQPPASVQLPPGWTVSGYREASQANSAGRIVQGIVFTLSSATSGSTSVFVPYSLLGQTDAVEQAFQQRISDITAITG